MSNVVNLYGTAYGNFSAPAVEQVRRETYGEDFGQSSWVTADEYRRFFQMLGLSAADHVLDVGCGSGGPALFLAREIGCRVTGVDVDAAGIRSGETLARPIRNGRKGRISQADVAQPLPFADNQFDALVSMDALCHFPERSRLFAEWCRILRPGGRLLVTDPVVVTGLVTKDELARRSSTGHFEFCPPGVNERLLRDAGFLLESVEDVTENAAQVSGRWHDAARTAVRRIAAVGRRRDVRRPAAIPGDRASSDPRTPLSRFVYLASKARTLRISCIEWLSGITVSVALVASGSNSPAAGPNETPSPVANIKAEKTPPRKWPRIDTSGFRDSGHHWRKIRNTSYFIQPVPDQPAYSPDQVPQILANILLFQRANGGWPKDYDMLAILTDEQRKAVVATHNHADTSFDNHNVHPQVDYLARAYSIGRDDSLRQACLRGLDFMLAAQLANGGFPQRYPKAKDYEVDITFNDGVTMGILNVLEDIAEGEPQWTWLDDARRKRARDAVARGIECILKCQIRVGDRLTGWCQQHDPVTFAAAPARTFELASICPQDSTEVVQFLMRFPKPSPRIVASVDACVEWLRKVRQSGIRVKKVPAPVEEYLRHTADFDVVVVADPKAPPIWARHYEIGTNRPVFAGRDGIKRYALAEIARERRTGTPWYGRWPSRLINREYPRWKRKLASL